MSWRKTWSWVRAKHHRADLGVTLAEVVAGTVVAVALLAVAAPMLVNTVAGWRLERSVTALSHSLAAASHRHAAASTPGVRPEDTLGSGRNDFSEGTEAEAATGGERGAAPSLNAQGARDQARARRAVERVAQMPRRNDPPILTP